MQTNEKVFVGVNPIRGAAHRLVYSALDADLNPICLESGDQAAVLALLASLPMAVVAICGPQRPNAGLLRQEHTRQRMQPVPRDGTWIDARVAEYQLHQHKIRIPRTAGQFEDCPVWMQDSFELYNALKDMGYQAYPKSDRPRLFLEVDPFAAFWAISGLSPVAKTSLEGRLQRQLILYDKGLYIPDPMRVFEEITRHRLIQGVLVLDGLYASQELDALVAAYTAWVADVHPERITTFGDHVEGQIVLPGQVL